MPKEWVGKLKEKKNEKKNHNKRILKIGTCE